MKYELAIAHRVCPALAKVAVAYDNKLDMVKATARSLADALNGIRTKLVVIFDGCDETYEKVFEEIFGKGHVDGVCYECVRTSAIGNHATYARQHEILSALVDEAENLYFSEDDYIYRREAFRAMMDFLKESGVDFVTPLDHPDRYSHFIPESRKVEIRVSDYCHWREVGTTCCTFMTTSRIFRSAHRLLECYGRGGCDGTLWLGLTKDYVFHVHVILWMLLRYMMGLDNTWAKCIAVSAWKYHNVKLLFSRRYHLWGPMPTLAVHLAKSSLPPFSKRLAPMV